MEARLFGHVAIVLAGLWAIERVRSRNALQRELRPKAERCGEAAQIDCYPRGWVRG